VALVLTLERSAGVATADSATADMRHTRLRDTVEGVTDCVRGGAIGMKAWPTAAIVATARVADFATVMMACTEPRSSKISPQG
jgi:hypothetical protein